MECGGVDWVDVIIDIGVCVRHTNVGIICLDVKKQKERLTGDPDHMRASALLSDKVK